MELLHNRAVYRIKDGSGYEGAANDCKICIKACKTYKDKEKR